MSEGVAFLLRRTINREIQIGVTHSQGGGELIWTVIHGVPSLRGAGVLRRLKRAVVSVILKWLWVLSYVEDIAFLERGERECVLYFIIQKGDMSDFLKEIRVAT